MQQQRAHDPAVIPKKMLGFCWDSRDERTADALSLWRDKWTALSGPLSREGAYMVLAHRSMHHSPWPKSRTTRFIFRISTTWCVVRAESSAALEVSSRGTGNCAFKNKYLSGSQEGLYLRLIGFCITQL